MSNPAETFFAPQLMVRNVIVALEFCKAAFDAVELRRFTNTDGTVHVAEMTIGGALFHIHEETLASKEMSPESVHGTTVQVGLFVSDPAAVVNKAVAAGAKELKPVIDYFYGYRQGTIVDPSGHHWLIQKKI